MKYRLLGCILLFFAMSGCVSLPDNSDRVASYAVSDTGDTMLAMGLADHREVVGDTDGFVLLDSGLDAFVARAVLAEVAEKTLDVQYYLYHSDSVGKLFTYILWDAAERGVRVRLLVDDMGMDDRDGRIIALDSHPNIEIRIFNPFDRSFSRLPQFVTGLGSVTRRMHNKSFTADNVAAILGGRNIGDEYFEASPTLEFADLDVLAIGDVVSEVSTAFDMYWNSPLAYPATTIIDEHLTEDEIEAREQFMLAFVDQHQGSAYLEALRNSSFARQIRNDIVPFYWGLADVVVDDPEKITHSRDANELHLASQLAPHFDSLEEELLILSPYFVPGKEGVEYYSQLIEKGVRVRILTNSLSSNDVAIVHAGYSKYRKPLLRAGVDLYEMNKKLTRAQRKEKRGGSGSSKASLHAKTFILDREKVFIGSLNLDPRSFYENTEIGLVLYQEELAREMAEGFDANIERDTFRLELKVDEDGSEQLLWHGYENGEPVTFNVEPYTGFWRRFGVGFMRLMPIESQL